MGQPKQLLQWQGKTLIRQTIETALATDCHKIIVVLGASANAIRMEIADFEVHIAENPDWPQGMSTSVKIGIQKLLEINIEAESALLLLTDQPLLTPAHLIELLHQPPATNNKKQASIIASFYNNKPGVPALFDKKWFDALQQLSGDQGARALFRQFPDEVQTIPFPEGAFDIDFPEDYQKLIG